MLDKSLAADGGVENLRGIENYSLQVNGDSVQLNQSRRTDKLDRTAYRAVVVIDVKNKRLLNDIETGFPGAERSFLLHEVFDGNERNAVIPAVVGGSFADCQRTRRLSPWYGSTHH